MVLLAYNKIKHIVLAYRSLENKFNFEIISNKFSDIPRISFDWHSECAYPITNI